MSAGSHKSLRASALAILAFAALLLFPSRTHAQEFGRLSGRVTSADSRLPLPGAHVRVEGTSIGAVTGDDGRFNIPRVPAGERTIRVTFIGRTPATQSVTVQAGALTTADVSLGTVTLSPVTVRASGQAEALSRQRHAPNIKNVVAADQMGRFPDASAPEAVQRLPGVALQRDQGEGRYVQLRGSSAATTQVTINGESIGSPEAGERQIALDAIPVGVLAAVEVSKAITPDMDADAVGGSVNLVTKRPGLSRTLTAEGSGGYSPLRERGSGLGALTYGDRALDGRLGFLFSGSFGERNFGSDDIEPSYDADALNELEVRHYSLWRRRSGATANIEFAASPNTTLLLSGLWSELQDQEQRRILAHLIEDGELAYLHKNRLEKLSTFNLLIGAEHQLVSGLTLDYRVGMTRSQEDTPFDREVAFLQSGVTFAPDRIDPDRPQPNPQGGALTGQYLFDELETGGTLTRNRDLVGAINLGMPLSFGSEGAGRLRFGLKVRDKDKDQAVDAFTVGLSGADIELGSDVGGSFNNTGFAAGSYPIPYFTSPSEVLRFQDLFAANLDVPESDVEAQTEAFDLRERVLAGYLMAELDLSPRLMLLPGLRVEQTTLATDANSFDAGTEVLTPVSEKNDYAHLFPMLHLRLRSSATTNVRAAYTRTIFRPNFVDLVPFRIVDGADIEQGNPALRPMLAHNYDFLVERYDEQVGVVSGGLFYKRLTDPIFTRTADNGGGGETSQPINAASGWIQGVELAWQRRFLELPGALAGIGIYANATFTDSRATQHDGRVTRLAGQAERAMNLAVSYERAGFSGQLSFNQVGRYIDELGEDATEDLFASSRGQLDLSMSYFATSSAQVYLEATNLTNAPYRTYEGSADRMRQHEFYRPSLQAGIRYRP